MSFAASFSFYLLKTFDSKLLMDWYFQFFWQDWFLLLKISLYFFFKNADLRDQIVSVQEEKKILAIELENLKSRLVEVTEEVCILGPKGRTFTVLRCLGTGCIKNLLLEANFWHENHVPILVFSCPHYSRPTKRYRK